MATRYLKVENLLSEMKLNDHDSLLDNINLRIIDILSKDSSTTFVEIAKQIGYDHLAFMGINVEPGFADEATLELANLDEVLEIHEMHGTFDLLLKIRARE